MAAVAVTYENHLKEDEGRWFAIYTKYKREKLSCGFLQKKGIEAYLPLQKVTRRWTRKVRIVELPLISCYVFVKIKKSDYVPVLQTEYVLEFVKIGKNLLAIPDKEIEIMRRVVGEGETLLSIEATRYQVGDRVEIISGNLIGLEGTLIESEGDKRMVIELENLGYSLHMQIAPELLRKTA